MNSAKIYEFSSVFVEKQKFLDKYRLVSVLLEIILLIFGKFRVRSAKFP